MLFSGNALLWSCSSLAMLFSGHALLWPCSSLVMLFSGHALLWPCSSLVSVGSSAVLFLRGANFCTSARSCLCCSAPLLKV
ncbi:hypothetical protein FPQ18DRAFT_322761 [Pyronema domesticum]|nr:hypothetical protein FPQ18DRAFT_322761 [Pyronema domesticum]